MNEWMNEWLIFLAGEVIRFTLFLEKCWGLNLEHALYHLSYILPPKLLIYQ